MQKHTDRMNIIVSRLKRIVILCYYNVIFILQSEFAFENYDNFYHSVQVCIRNTVCEN